MVLLPVRVFMRPMQKTPTSAPKLRALTSTLPRGSLRAQSHVCHAGLVLVGAATDGSFYMCLLDTLSDGRVSSRHVLARGHRCGCSDRKSNQKCKGKLVCVPHELSSIGVRRFHAIHYILVFSAEAMSGSKADIDHAALTLTYRDL